MGTRSDFYVGKGPEAEWLGSVAWDGYPSGIDKAVLEAKTEADYRTALEAFSQTRKDFTSPEMGWPWPWDDSCTSDYAYTFADGEVWASRFGRPYLTIPDLAKFESNDETPEAQEYFEGNSKSEVFPDMTARKKVTFGGRSGLIIVGSQGIVDEP